MYALQVQGSYLDQTLAKKSYMRYSLYFFCFTVGIRVVVLNHGHLNVSEKKLTDLNF